MLIPIFFRTFAPENTKFVFMKKFLLLFAAGFFFFSCANNESSSTEASSTTSEVTSAPEETEPIGKLVPEEDNRPPIVLEGEGYQLELPAFAEDVQCEPISDEQEEELRSQGYEFVVKPLNVTRNGENHVQLGQPATVCFAIPEDYPVDKYDELVGVLITDDGPEYKIPDYYALREGYIKFQTSHFTIASAEQKQYELREKFIEEVAVYGWGRNMSNKDMEPTMRAQINKFAEDFCLGENDLVGIAMREVFGEKDFVKIGLDIVNAYDMENASLEQRMAVASETMIKLAKGKVLSYFIKKLKTDETKKVKVLDEIKSEKKGEFVYKTELVNIDSRRNKVIGVLEEHFSMENAEKVGTVMGDNPTFEQCYIYACEYIGNFAKEKTKEALIEMIPYLGYLKQMATAVEIWKKFWAATQMQDLYKTYEKKANAKGALLNSDEWDWLTMYISAPKFLHGMTDMQMKDYIEQRYIEQKEIEERKDALRKYIALIEETVDMNSPCFEQKHFDYVQRLTVINNLIDRFYDELVEDDGYLIYVDNGYRQAVHSPFEIDRQLCYVVDEYLKCYPDREKFYAWLKKNGYHFGQLEKEYERLDKVLWKDEKVKPQDDPDVHIVIQESLGASGHAKYAGYTICLGTKGKPYTEWHRDIPNADWVRDEGWSTEFPDSDEDMKLSEYKAIGMPNQVLFYTSEEDFFNGVDPVETFAFQVDTTGYKTTVELNGGKDYIIELVLDTKPHVGGGTRINCRSDGTVDGRFGFTPGVPRDAMYDAFKDALSKVHLHLNSKGDGFSFTTSGDGTHTDYGSTDEETAHIDLTVSGNVDFVNKTGTCSMSATVKGVTSYGTKSTALFKNFTGEIEVDASGYYSIACRTTGNVHITGVDKDGKQIVTKPDSNPVIHDVEGEITIVFSEVQD